MPATDGKQRRIAVIGGGLAGLAAATALVERGADVTLLERTPRLGGRASGVWDPVIGQHIDGCQHVAMGCCTNVLRFHERLGTRVHWRPADQLHFIDADGRLHPFRASKRLPAPLHLAPAMLRQSYLSPMERLHVARTMLRLAWVGERLRDEDDVAIGPWLLEQGASPGAIDRFWSPVLVSALGAPLERASLLASAKVLHDGFLAHPAAQTLLIPDRSLHELHDEAARRWLMERGATIRCGVNVEAVRPRENGDVAVEMSNGERETFDAAIVAVPHHAVKRLLPAWDALDAADEMQSSAITSIHVWLDRPFTRLPHAVLLDATGEWLFRHDERHHQIVVSASEALLGEDRERLVRRVLDELLRRWPTLGGSRVEHWRVAHHPRAIFSATPGVNTIRPSSRTPWPNVFLAGDWTATGWPATMESAVRSGFAAVETLIEQRTGKRPALVAPDLERGALTCWLLRGFLE